jgi:hypothetical protein
MNFFQFFRKVRGFPFQHFLHIRIEKGGKNPDEKRREPQKARKKGRKRAGKREL